MTLTPWDEEGHDRFLLVEGYSDLRFFAELLEDMKIGKVEGKDASDCYIKDCKSKSQAFGVIETWLDPELLARAKAIAVILDADDEPAKTRRRLARVLKQATGAEVPETGGWAPSNSRARIGFYVVPGGCGDEAGEIETLAWRAWSGDAAKAGQLTCIESFLSCMDAAGASPRSRAEGSDKARLAALLSIHNAEDPRLGPGAQKRVFDFESPSFEELRKFLEGLRGE